MALVRRPAGRWRSRRPGRGSSRASAPGSSGARGPGCAGRAKRLSATSGADPWQGCRTDAVRLLGQGRAEARGAGRVGPGLGRRPGEPAGVLVVVAGQRILLPSPPGPGSQVRGSPELRGPRRRGPAGRPAASTSWVIPLHARAAAWSAGRLPRPARVPLERGRRPGGGEGEGVERGRYGPGESSPCRRLTRRRRPPRTRALGVRGAGKVRRGGPAEA